MARSSCGWAREMARANLSAIRSHSDSSRPSDGLHVERFRAFPFAWLRSASTTEAKSTLASPNEMNCACCGSLRLRFFLLWLLLVLLGFAIVFYTTRRMLSHVREITEAASRIGHSDLNARVPTTRAQRRSRATGAARSTACWTASRVPCTSCTPSRIRLAHDLAQPADSNSRKAGDVAVGCDSRASRRSRLFPQLRNWIV